MKKIFAYFRQNYQKYCDVFPDVRNGPNHRNAWDPEFQWPTHTYANPPYSKDSIEKTILKAKEERKFRATTLLIIIHKNRVGNRGIWHKKEGGKWLLNAGFENKIFDNITFSSPDLPDEDPRKKTCISVHCFLITRQSTKPPRTYLANMPDTEDETLPWRKRMTQLFSYSETPKRRRKMSVTRDETPPCKKRMAALFPRAAYGDCSDLESQSTESIYSSV